MQTLFNLKLHTSFFLQKSPHSYVPLKSFTHFFFCISEEKKKLIKLSDQFEFRKCWQCGKERHSAFQSSGGEEKKKRF